MKPIVKKVLEESAELGKNLVTEAGKAPIQMAADVANQTDILGREINLQQAKASHQAQDQKQISSIEEDLKRFKSTPQFAAHSESVINPIPRAEKAQIQGEAEPITKSIPPLFLPTSIKQGPGGTKKTPMPRLSTGEQLRRRDQ